MATASTVNHQTVPVPAPDVPRNLANLPPEILQMIFRIVLSGATIFCPCDMFSVNTKKHDLHGDWIILLACRRFQREGLPTWYRVVTMEFGRFYPAHSPTSQLDHCEKIKLGPHLGPGPPLSTNLPAISPDTIPPPQGDRASTIDCYHQHPLS